MSVFDFDRIGTATTGPLLPLLTRAINYNDLERVDQVATIDLAGVPLKFISHRDIPQGEIHVVLDRRCVGKIVNIE